MKTFTKQITVILLVFIAIVACNKEEAVAETPVAETPVAENPTPENPLSENSVTGAVRLPAGSTIDSNGLTLVSAVDIVSVSDGSYTMDTVADKFLTQLVTDANDDVLLMGFSYPGQTDFEINAKSTALAMLMNLPTSLLMAPEGKQELITTILSHAEFVALADRIDVILAQGERPLDSTQLELAEAVGNFYAGIFTTQTNKTGKSDDENYPVGIRLTNNEIIFTNPGKSYDTKIGIYKDGQAVHQVTMDRINFVPTGIGDIIGAIASATLGEIPTGLQPTEKSYTLEGDGEFTIKVRNGFYTNGLDADNIAAWISNMTGWSIDVLVEIIPLGDCVQPLISDFKEFAQTALTFQEAPAPGEVLGLIYNLISEFLNDSVIVAGCFLNPTENDAYLKALGKLTNFTGMVGLFGNVGNTMLGVYQWFTDDGAIDKCYNVEGTNASECDVTGVYVAGYELLENNIPVAKIWKNGSVTSLAEGGTIATSVYVSGSDVYVAGIVTDQATTIGVATVWKNGVATLLTDGRGTAYASSVYVSGNDVYVAGSQLKDNKYVATLWKNGFPTFLNNNGNNAHVTSVHISENEVYVVGNESNENNKTIAKVWKNGVATALTDGSKNASAESVYVSDGDVYVVGHEYANFTTNAVAKIWKNGIESSLSDGSIQAFANSVYVSGSDVYVAGLEYNTYNSIAKVWKNGVSTSLSDGSNYAEARSVYVLGNDVYVAGQEHDGIGRLVAKFWKNGVATSLTDGSSHIARAYSIFVKEK